MPLCFCDCGEPTRRRRKFIIGHDQRMIWRLAKSVGGIEELVKAHLEDQSKTSP